MCIDGVIIDTCKRLRFYDIVIVCQCLYKQINYAIPGICVTSISQHKKPRRSSN